VRKAEKGKKNYRLLATLSFQKKCSVRLKMHQINFLLGLEPEPNCGCFRPAPTRLRRGNLPSHSPSTGRRSRSRRHDFSATPIMTDRWNDWEGVYAIQQTSSKSIHNTRANAGRNLLDRANTPWRFARGLDISQFAPETFGALDVSPTKNCMQTTAKTDGRTAKAIEKTTGKITQKKDVVFAVRHLLRPFVLAVSRNF